MLFVSVLFGLTPLTACQAAPAETLEPDRSSNTELVAGPCAARSDDRTLLPDDPGPEYFQTAFRQYWKQDGDTKTTHSFGLVSPHRMMYRKSGINGFGGIVPLWRDAIAPWTFRHSAETAVIFVTTDCAELRDVQDGVVTQQVVGVLTAVR